MLSVLQLGDVCVDVLRKDIRHLYLSVHPPTGRVRITAPKRMSLDALRLFAIGKLGWIKRHQREILQQDREPPREFLHWETHYLWGQRRLLRLVYIDGKPNVSLQYRHIVLTVRSRTPPERCGEILHEWHKSLLHEAIPPIIRQWEPKLGVKVNAYFLQPMKTQWGSCNPAKGHIRLNTELVKKDKHLLEYVILHEMLHLIENRHSDRFISLLDGFYPGWRSLRDALNNLPLGSVNWNRKKSSTIIQSHNTDTRYGQINAPANFPPSARRWRS